MIFDAVQEVPQVCCISWLILLSANAMCPLTNNSDTITALTNNSANVAIVMRLIVQYKLANSSILELLQINRSYGIIKI